MLIAWQSINAARQPNSSLFSRGFLMVAPGITSRDRLRVLLPSDPDNYYTRELVPPHMEFDLGKTKIVVTKLPRLPAPEGVRSEPGRRAPDAGADRRTDRKTGAEGEMLQRA